MAVSKQEVILEFNADTGQVESATSKITKNLEQANKATEELSEGFGDVASSLFQLKGGFRIGFRLALAVFVPESAFLIADSKWFFEMSKPFPPVLQHRLSLQNPLRAEE